MNTVLPARLRPVTASETVEPWTKSAAVASQSERNAAPRSSAVVDGQPHDGPEPGQVAVAHPAQVELHHLMSLGQFVQGRHQGGIRRLVDLPGDGQAGRGGGLGDPQYPVVKSLVRLGHHGSTSLARL